MSIPTLITRRTVIGGLGLSLSGLAAETYPRKRWPSEPLPGCPFAETTTLRGIVFTGRHAQYANADTWYPSWASDGNLYSPWTDGKVNGLSSSSNGTEHPEVATTGQAAVLGDSPLDLKIVNESV